MPLVSDLILSQSAKSVLCPLCLNQCFLNAIVQCLSHTHGLRAYCLLKLYQREKFSKEDAKLTDGTCVSVCLCVHVRAFACVRVRALLPVISHLTSASWFCAAAFHQVLSGLWDENEGDAAMNPQQFYSLFKEAVPYFSGYR